MASSSGEQERPRWQAPPWRSAVTPPWRLDLVAPFWRERTPWRQEAARKNAAVKSMPKPKRGTGALSMALESPPPEVITIEDNDEADRTASLALLAIEDVNVVIDEADRTASAADTVIADGATHSPVNATDSTATMAPQVEDSTAQAADSQAHAADSPANAEDSTAEATASTANAEDSTANATDGTANDADASDRAAQIADLKRKYAEIFGRLDLLHQR
jgi:hypothetical protein